jgi:uncharacterized membrane protein
MKKVKSVFASVLDMRFDAFIGAALFTGFGIIGLASFKTLPGSPAAVMQQIGCIAFASLAGIFIVLSLLSLFLESRSAKR